MNRAAAFELLRQFVEFMSDEGITKPSTSDINWFLDDTAADE
ncbi:hypothetical protein [Mycobacterium sp. 1245801.1]|nr:hypothetical protein [Mycobacterium sp. 1245801.1]